MKIDNAPPVQSMSLDKSQKTTNSSNFNKQLTDQIETNKNISTQLTAPTLQNNIPLAEVNIISRQAAPFLSIDEIKFFEDMMQKNINPQRNYKTQQPTTSNINIKT